MHNLPLMNEFGSSTVVVVEPEGLGLEEILGFGEEVMIEGSYAIANIAVIDLSANEAESLHGAS